MTERERVLAAARALGDWPRARSVARMWAVPVDEVIAAVRRQGIEPWLPEGGNELARAAVPLPPELEPRGEAEADGTR